MGVAVMLALAPACGGSDDGAGSGGGSDETADVLRHDEGFEVAAADDTGWLLVGREPTEVWEVGPDGILTRRAEVAEGGGEIAAVGDGVAVTRFRCTDATDDECGAPLAEVLLLDEHGSVEHELTVVESDDSSLEGVGMNVVGASDEHVWVEVSAGSIQLFAVSRAGDVEEVPLERRRFAFDEPCAVEGELLMTRVHTDLYDPEQGPPDTGVVMSAETPIRTTVSLESLAEGEWRPVPGSERTVEVRGAEARAACRSSSVEIVGAPTGGEDRTLARWTPDGGWVDAPPGPETAPPGSVAVDGCADCVWGSGGEILRRGDDGTFEPTGLVVVDPDGADDAPVQTQVDIDRHGAMVACARFPEAGPDASTPSTAPPTTVAVTAVAAPGRPSQPGGQPLVCDLVPA